tara:strand:- start:1461 stop:1832 length:372 start_codon:yes stop_codon:yes gene_type:complete
MVSVRLSDNSTIPRLSLKGLEQAFVITRREPASVPIAWAIPRLSDKELLFVFEESERSELEALEGHLLEMALSELELAEDVSVSETLLGKKKRSAASQTKAAAQKVKSSISKKSSLAPESNDS